MTCLRREFPPVVSHQSHLIIVDFSDRVRLSVIHSQRLRTEHRQTYTRNSMWQWARRAAQVRRGSKMASRSSVTMIGLVLVLVVVLERFTFSSQLSPSQGKEKEEELLEVFDFGTAYQPPHMTPVNVSSLIIREKLYPIDHVHRNALPHFGAWIMVVDSQQRILCLQRGPHLVTCPNSWGLTGEHRLGREQPLETVRRGMQEELGPDMARHVRFMRPLSPLPMFYFRDYGPTNGNRVDRQLTYVWWVQMDRPFTNLPLRLDDEVANHRWITVPELEDWFRDAHNNINTTGDAGLHVCHHTVLSLWEFMLAEYKRMVNGAV